MSQAGNHLPAAEIHAQLSEGPTSPKPGPMFLRAAMVGLMPLRWSLSSTSTMKHPPARTRKMVTMKQQRAGLTMRAETVKGE